MTFVQVESVTNCTKNPIPGVRAGFYCNDSDFFLKITVWNRVLENPTGLLSLTLFVTFHGCSFKTTESLSSDNCCRDLRMDAQHNKIMRKTLIAVCWFVNYIICAKIFYKLTRFFWKFCSKTLILNIVIVSH